MKIDEQAAMMMPNAIGTAKLAEQHAEQHNPESRDEREHDGADLDVFVRQARDGQQRDNRTAVRQRLEPP